MLLWLGCSASGLAALGIESLLGGTIPITEAAQITPFLISFFTLNLVQNIVTTCLYGLLPSEHTSNLNWQL